METGFRVDGHFIPIEFDKSGDGKLQVSELSIWCKANDFEYKDKKIVPATQFDVKTDAAQKFDKEKYSLDALKQRYPKDKYNVSYYQDENGALRNFTVRDKESFSCIFSLTIRESNVASVRYYDDMENEVYYKRYDSAGKLLFYDEGEERHYPIVDNIYDDIRKTTKLGVPTTGKDIVKHVKEITPENVYLILEAYKNKADNSIFQDIFSERGLKPEERAMLVRHIKNMLVEKLKSLGIYTDDLNRDLEFGIGYEQKKIGLMSADDIDKDIDALLRRYKTNGPVTTPNGKIDQDFQQGNTGDCWLLAAIKSISNNPKGLEILNNSISVNEFGDVTVHLKGVNKTYTIYKEELEGAGELASGDGDIRALEIAVNRYMKETNRDAWDPNNSYDIEGNYSDVAYDILLGTGKSLKTTCGGWGAIYDLLFGDCYNSDLIEKAKQGDAIINVSVHMRETRSAKDENNNEVQIYENHAYSVVDADDEYVYLINPWDSSTKIKMTHEDFKDTFNSVRTVDLT